MGNRIDFCLLEEIFEKNMFEEKYFNKNDNVALKILMLLDDFSEGFLVLDTEDQIIFINKKAAEVLALDNDKIIGANLNNIALDQSIIDFVGKARAGSTKIVEEMGDGTLGSWLELEAIFNDEFLGIVIRDIKGRKEAQNEQKNSYESIRNLNTHMQLAREDERASLAREIHDQLGQRLTGFKMEIDYILRKSQNLETFVTEKLRNVINQIDRTIGTVRNISRNLRPGILDDFGLLAALEWQADEFTKTSGIPVFFQYLGEEKKTDNQKVTAIFRVYQESLTNIMRHAKCTHVNVMVNFGAEKIALEVADNGKGFNPEILKNQKSLGVFGMKERIESIGGKFEIESAEGKGTKVKLEMP
ncbi:ATP-binding protein [Aquiflexum sp.]|uniref:sensor histidine kinase n=1 Tax=Aquiflexum sp. TaxID=1872584 RepID=UPI003592F6AF